MIVDISDNLARFGRRRSPEARYASFDYCFNYFQHARDNKETADLGSGSRLELSCLHLGFYLASWGMMRGSGALHRRSLRELAPVVQAIAAEPPGSWEIDVPRYTEIGIGAVLALGKRIENAYTFPASSILVSKTMLGVFGCVPAFDRFFRMGFGGGRLNRETLTGISDFYKANKSALDAVHIPTLDFLTGKNTSRSYTTAKIIDMIFFEEGFKQTGRVRLLRQIFPPAAVCKPPQSAGRYCMCAGARSVPASTAADTDRYLRLPRGARRPSALSTLACTGFACTFHGYPYGQYLNLFLN